jgi:ABC-type nitrate/sulfonate/bicarbonate transport system permease component
MSAFLNMLARAVPLLVAFAVIVAVWQSVIWLFAPHVSLLPPPLLPAQEFWKLLVSGDLFVHTGMSLMRVVSAWCLAGCVAIPLGLAMGWSSRFERIADPFVELFRPISPLAWIPLAILWFGINEPGKIFVLAQDLQAKGTRLVITELGPTAAQIVHDSRLDQVADVVPRIEDALTR